MLCSSESMSADKVQARVKSSLSRWGFPHRRLSCVIKAALVTRRKQFKMVWSSGGRLVVNVAHGKSSLMQWGLQAWPSITAQSLWKSSIKWCKVRLPFLWSTLVHNASCSLVCVLRTVGVTCVPPLHLCDWSYYAGNKWPTHQTTVVCLFQRVTLVQVITELHNLCVLCDTCA